MFRIRFILPLVIFGILVAFLWKGLARDPNLLPSALIGQPVPIFQASSLEGRKVTHESFKGTVTLLNVWATDCDACQVEHPFLIDIAKKEGIQVVGLNYKDNRQAANHFLSKMGNPYKEVIYDPEGKYGMLFGVYGTPETYLINKRGIVCYCYVGQITFDVMNEDLLPRIARLLEK